MLFCKELKKIVLGIPYLLMVIVIVLALYSQGVLDFRNDEVSPPTAGGNYGTKYEEIPEIIMPAATEALYAEFQENLYKTYPFGLIKHVKLSEEEQKQIAGILSKITGVPADTIYNSSTASGKNQEDENTGDGTDGTFAIGENMEINADGGFVISTGGSSVSDDTNKSIHNTDKNSAQDITLTVRDDISYTEFKELMQQADDITGGGSFYEAESLTSFGKTAVTYEEAADRYELAKNHDHMTGGYARLFCDYAVAAVMCVVPVFPAVIMSLKDRQADMTQLIYTRKTPGIKIVLLRYLAVIVSVMLPVILLSYISNVSVWNLYDGIKLDYLAPLKYDLGWILPSVMTAAAVGMFLTELTNTPIAIAVQGFWWFLDINRGIKSVQSGYSLFRLAPRHNSGALSYFRTQDFISHFSDLLMNRLLFTGLSILLITATVIIYEAKRKGYLHGIHRHKRASAHFRNRKSQPEA